MAVIAFSMLHASTCGWRIASLTRNPVRLSSFVILGVVRLVPGDGERRSGAPALSILTASVRTWSGSGEGGGALDDVLLSDSRCQGDRSAAGRAGGWRSRRRGRARRARSCRAARWGGSTGRIRAPYMCTRPPLVAPHTSPSRRRRTFPFPVRPTRANVDGRRLPAATTKEGPSP